MNNWVQYISMKMFIEKSVLSVAILLSTLWDTVCAEKPCDWQIEVHKEDCMDVWQRNNALQLLLLLSIITVKSKIALKNTER